MNNPFDNPDLVFNEKQHRYVLATHPEVQLKSVTQLVKEYSRPFDEMAMSVSVAKKRGVQAAGLRREWREKREAAATLGTAVHAEAERVALQIASTGFFRVSENAYSMAGKKNGGYVDAVYKFYSEHPELTYNVCAPEVRIASPEHELAGSIDLVCGLDGPLTIVDFKTSAKFNMFGYKNMYAPMNHLPDSNYWHYALQLNVYAVLLEELFGYHVSQTKLVWLLPSGKYQAVYVPDLKDQVVKLLARRARKRKKDRK